MKAYTLIIGDEHGLRGGMSSRKESLTPESLKMRRKNLGWSRRELAERSGYSEVFISKIERGERSMSVRSHNDLLRALWAAEDEK